MTAPDSNDLTDRQQRVYEVIRDKINARGYGPTVREIGEILNISSPNGVMCHLRALERKGKISRTANRSRAIELTEKSHRLGGNVMLPVRGSVTPNHCVISDSDSDVLNVGDLLVGTDRFALRVLGDTLLHAHISNGDLLVVQQQNQAISGQLALVRTDESSEPKLRFYYSEQGKVKLASTNTPNQSTSASSPEVLGVVVGVIRTFDM